MSARMRPRTLPAKQSLASANKNEKKYRGTARVLHRAERSGRLNLYRAEHHHPEEGETVLAPRSPFRHHAAYRRSAHAVARAEWRPRTYLHRTLQFLPADGR